MITTQQTQDHFPALNLTEDEAAQIRDFMYMLAEIEVNQLLSQDNSTVYDDNKIQAGKYRRAG